MEKKTIIISGINFFEGGPLSIFKDCLEYANSYLDNYVFIALVHKSDLFDQSHFHNIKFIEFPNSRKSYFIRLYYEFFFFKRLVKLHNVKFWLSLHDISPFVGKIPQAVYCHNPSPFYNIQLNDIYRQPNQIFFRFLYKFIYQINIIKNKFVIVQQLWIKDKFVEMFHLKRSQILVAPPQIPVIPKKFLEQQCLVKKDIKSFVFPTYPRSFKNVEIICEATMLLLENKVLDFEVLITISGHENNYAKYIYNKYKHIENLKFIGLLNRESVFEKYIYSDFLIFPSKLETWGLPISEFKQFNKPVLVADLPYAKETVGDYHLAIFLMLITPFSWHI